MAEIRLSTLSARISATGVTVLGFITGGKPVGLNPAALYPTADQIGAATTVELNQALSLKENVENRGLANGYASLGSDGKVPATQLPAGTGGGGAALSDAAPANLGGVPSAGTGGTAARADHVHQMPNAADVGAAPVAHTHSIAAVTGLQMVLDSKLGTAQRGVPSGVASLGADGLVPSTQLPPGISQASLDAKADAAATTAALNTKAATTYVDNQLSLKLNADDSRVANAIQPDYLDVPVGFGSNLTVAQTDNNKTRRCTSATDVTVTLPAVSIGTTVKFTQGNTGRMTFAAGAGQALESVGNLFITNGKGSNVIAHYQATNLWNISGNLV